MSDPVNHPPHYGGGSNPYETIKKIASKGIDYLRGFCLGNAEKYIDRAGKKEGEDELKDLKKARWYLDFFISYLEKGGEVIDVQQITGELLAEIDAVIQGTVHWQGGRLDTIKHLLACTEGGVWYLTENQLPPAEELVIAFWPAHSSILGDFCDITNVFGISLIVIRHEDKWGMGIRNPPKYWAKLPG